MNNFDYLTSDSAILGVHHLEDFYLKWQEFDPNGTYDLLMECHQFNETHIGKSTKMRCKTTYCYFLKCTAIARKQFDMNFSGAGDLYIPNFPYPQIR